MHQSIPAVPIPPDNSGAFSHTFHPGGRALAFHPITPGHLTISLLSPHNIDVSFNDHFIGKAENQQNAATVDSCFELVDFRQHGVAQHKVEQPTRVSRLPNARGSDFGWAQIQTSVHVIARDYEQ